MNTTSHESEILAQGQHIITACAFLHHSCDGGINLFLPQRADPKKFLPGVYERSGGHVDFGEDLLAGRKREVREAFDRDSSAGDPFAAFPSTNEGKRSHALDVMFFAQCTDPIEQITRNPEDHSEYGWFVRDERSQAHNDKKSEDGPQHIAMLKALTLLAGVGPDGS